MGRSVNVVTTKQWQCAIAKCRVVDSYLGALRTFYACLVFVWSNGTTESVCMGWARRVIFQVSEWIRSAHIFV